MVELPFRLYKFKFVGSPLSYSKTYKDGLMLTVIFCLICNGLAPAHLPSLVSQHHTVFNFRPRRSHSSCSHLPCSYLVLIYFHYLKSTLRPSKPLAWHLLHEAFSVQFSSYCLFRIFNVFKAGTVFQEVLFSNTCLIILILVTLQTHGLFPLYYFQWPVQHMYSFNTQRWCT